MQHVGNSAKLELMGMPGRLHPSQARPSYSTHRRARAPGVGANDGAGLDVQQRKHAAARNLGGPHLRMERGGSRWVGKVG